MSDFWIFGYGSLMWKPGFPFLERQPATIHGVHRALCVRSFVHRGTRERPGLVLGLDRGGSCRGIAFRAAGSSRDEIIDYLRSRELVTHVYREQWRRVRLASGKPVTAVTYVVDPAHEQYAGRLPDHEVCDAIRNGSGKSGANIDYVLNTIGHLREMEVHDPHLEALGKLLEY